MRLRSFVMAGGTLLMVATLCLGQAAQKKMPPRPHAKSAAMAPMSMGPPPEMAKVSWLSGNWTCSGKTYASPTMGPAHPTEATVSAGPELGGHWVVSRYREKKTPQNAMPTEADEYWTYDAAAKTWQRLVMDTTGGWAVGTSPGWDRGKIVWTSEGAMGGQKMKLRDTFTQKSAREIAYVGEIGSSDGKFSTIWNVTCKK